MIDLGWLGQIEFTWAFFSAIMSIVLIDLVLAGDNAVVIAMAVKNLPARQRLWGIALGSGGAVIIRVLCTFLVAQLLVMPYVKLIGGAVILWIAVKLLPQGAAERSHAHRKAAGLLQALWIIVVADLSMGIDNMLAVGAASHGSMLLLLFGLGLSIPFVVFMSNMLSKLMDRFPIILWVGAGILGKVGGQMMITDPWIQGVFPAPAWTVYLVEAIGIAFVCGLAKLLLWRRRAAARMSMGVSAEPAV
ncbi:MAG TPA: TerC family protein [Candidatus Methylomirabilis sp.]|nr:TerC family protein [Candidatus Methylomirabilis sp.]